MAGWSSFNKYSLLGGLRSAAQVVSYEIPLTLSVVGVIMLAGTMSLNGIVLGQAGSVLGLVHLPPAARRSLIFFIAATAEANRTPFDLTEADSEIVAGFATEYSRHAVRLLLLRRVRQRVHAVRRWPCAVLRRLERADQLAVPRRPARHDPGELGHGARC